MGEDLEILRQMKTNNQSPYDSWSNDDLATEIQARMNYFYRKTDQSMAFPNNATGDMLKIVQVLISRLKNN